MFSWVRFWFVKVFCFVRGSKGKVFRNECQGVEFLEDVAKVETFWLILTHNSLHLLDGLRLSVLKKGLAHADVRKVRMHPPSCWQWQMLMCLGQLTWSRETGVGVLAEEDMTVEVQRSCFQGLRHTYRQFCDYLNNKVVTGPDFQGLRHTYRQFCDYLNNKVVTGPDTFWPNNSLYSSWLRFFSIPDTSVILPTTTSSCGSEEVREMAGLWHWTQRDI